MYITNNERCRSRDVFMKIAMSSFILNLSTVRQSRIQRCLRSNPPFLAKEFTKMGVKLTDLSLNALRSKFSSVRAASYGLEGSEFVIATGMPLFGSNQFSIVYAFPESPKCYQPKDPLFGFPLVVDQFKELSCGKADSTGYLIAISRIYPAFYNINNYD